MAEGRDRPYAQFNFLVDVGGGVNGPDAGFQEVSGIGVEVAVAEYRNGNDQENHVRKVTGLYKSQDLTLKRGIIGTTTLYTWVDAIRRGQSDLRKVTIQLQSEDHSSTVMTWTLDNARIIKYTCGPFNAKGTDVAMEEMVVAFERLDLTAGS
jgi:phage tail-like protein